MNVGSWRVAELQNSAFEFEWVKKRGRISKILWQSKCTGTA
jgi:hypothetical protein